MTIKVERTNYRDIKYLRNLYLQENNFQIRYHSCHERNWSASYFLIFGGQKIGYGSIKGKEDLEERDAIFEFYVIPPFRDHSRDLFSALIEVSKAKFAESQTNDSLMTSNVYEFAKNIKSDTILFEDHKTTNHSMPGIQFRKRKESDEVFGKKEEDKGDYVLVKNEKIVATGGFLLHYNMPFADLYMEVEENNRKKGLGQYLVQELKRECYLSGRVPAARCNSSNEASKATLLKAGLRIAGYMISGELN